MKEFLKYTLATIVGIHISALLLLLIGIGIAGSILLSKESSVTLKDHTFLVLDLDGTLTERSTETPIDKILGSSFKSQGLEQILNSIEKARNNPYITGIYLQAGQLSASTASLQEIRSALQRFKESGKTIIAYGDNYTQGLYYLASISNLVALNPVGSVEWKGVSAQNFFYKDLLQKLGIEVQIFRVGSYKSAVEPFLRENMSPENKQQYTKLIQSVWKQILQGVSESRRISTDSLNQFADRGIFFAASQEYVKTHLVDTLLYRNQVREQLQRLTQSSKKEDPRLVSVEEFLRVAEESSVPEQKKQIAVYYAYGEIDSYVSSPDEEGINSRKVARDLRRLQEDEDIKAVVLRVNSPGGSAFGAEQLWKAVSDLNKVKPVVVSMGGYAASGGYYMSVAAPTIVAEPTTLTGSIGIFGMVPCVEKTAQKVGIGIDRVLTNPHADLYTITRPLSPAEKKLMQQMLERGYDLFITRCAEGRKMSKEAIEKIAQGHVWTGVEAQHLKLVDQLGGISKAITLAAEKAKIKGYTVQAYPETKGFFESLLEEDTYRKMKARMSQFVPGYDFIEKTSYVINNSSRFNVQTRIPYQLTIE